MYYSVPMAPFWKHILPFWKMRDQENILFLTYEEMKRVRWKVYLYHGRFTIDIFCWNVYCTLQDQAAAIKKTATFLGKNVTDEQIVKLCEHLKFSKMAANPSVNMENMLSDRSRQEDPNYKFIRKGKIGDWMNYMSKDLSQRFDKWTEENLRGTDLQFRTDVVDDEE